jgi:murein hydrolase activator
MTGRARITLAAVLLAVSAGVWLSAAAQDEISQKQQELERIKQQIQQHRDEAKRLASQEQDVVQKLQSLDQQIDLQQEYIDKLGEQEDAIDHRIGDLMSQIGRQETTLSLQQDALARRLRAMYKRDPTDHWQIILGAASLRDAVTRYQFTRLIAQQDARLIADVRDTKHQLETESARLNESREQIMAVRAEREQESTQLESAKEERQQTLAQIRNEKGEHAKAIKDLEQAQARLESIIQDLTQRRAISDKDLPPSGEFASMKGRLIWPVTGRVISAFGKHTNPKYGTVTMNNGLDIEAKAGTPIVAVADGAVEFVDWIDAFGKCVILNHGGGYYTLYAHLATTTVKQGQKVKRGQTIAEVGNTGSLEGYVCHFEVRQARKALDPSDWLGRQ